MPRYIVTNIRCHGEGEKSVVYSLFGRLCKSHKALTEMARARSIPVSDKKTMAQALKIPYRDLSWLIRHSKSSSGYDYPHIKLSLIPGSKLDPKYSTVEERVFSYFFFVYFIDKLSHAIENDELDVDKLDYSDLTGPYEEITTEQHYFRMIRDSKNNIETSVTKIMRSFGYGEFSKQVFEKVYPAIYAFARRLGNYTFDDNSKELTVTRALKQYSTYSRVSDVFFQASEYRGNSFAPFKIPLYIPNRNIAKYHHDDGFGNYVLSLKRKLKFSYESKFDVYGQNTFETTVPIESKNGWSFKYRSLFMPHIYTHESGDLYLYMNYDDRRGDRKHYVIPGLWYVIHKKDFFYLTENTGYLINCEDPQLRCMNRSDFTSYCRIHRIFIPQGNETYSFEPMYIGFENQVFMIFPKALNGEDNLPEDIFASQKRVVESLEKFIS